MLLILKVFGNYCGIRLVEVVWKEVVVILDCRFIASIAYHDSLHKFQEVSGTGTATLDIKLLHQLTAMREEVLHAIFLDLNKAYNGLDRSRCL